MADSSFAKQLLVTAKKSYDKIGESIQLFQAFMSSEGDADVSKYYLARNRFKDGQALLEETLAEAKKFLGPQPPYTSAAIQETRRQALRESGVILESQTVEDLEAELLADEYIKAFMNSDKVVGYVHEAGNYQTPGKRKLQNIKIRMVIDQLIAKADEARALQQRASEKIQTK